jgi:hypothetical protein
MLHCKRSFAPQHNMARIFKNQVYQSTIYGSSGSAEMGWKDETRGMLRDLPDYSCYWALPSRGARLRAGQAALVVIAMQLEGWPRG